MMIKNRIKKIGVLILMCCSLTGCQPKELKAQEEYEKLVAEIDDLKAEKERLKSEVTEIKKEHGLEKYVITLRISQRHITLDISEHLKDSLNDIEIQIPVDKEYYDNLEIGDTIDDSFRVGSLIMKSSWGSWNVQVINKEIM